MHGPTAPIGIFDSGLGGLTVARAIRAALPSEQLIYLGDTARVPYGTRSPATVCSYAERCARQLAGYEIKLLVVACNTVSAVALPRLAEVFGGPILGVIEPGARASLAATRNRQIGVLATQGTIDSGAYPAALARLDPRARVSAQAASMLVPLAEEGWTEGEIARLCCERYVAPLLDTGVDTLLLGCTHYPLLRDTIQSVADALAKGPVAIADAADATAIELGELLTCHHLHAPTSAPGGLSILVTDVPRRFEDVATRFLGASLGPVAVRAIDL